MAHNFKMSLVLTHRFAIKEGNSAKIQNREENFCLELHLSVRTSISGPSFLFSLIMVEFEHQKRASVYATAQTLN